MVWRSIKLRAPRPLFIDESARMRPLHEYERFLSCLLACLPACDSRHSTRSDAAAATAQKASAHLADGPLARLPHNVATTSSQHTHTRVHTHTRYSEPSVRKVCLACSSGSGSIFASHFARPHTMRCRMRLARKRAARVVKLHTHTRTHCARTSNLQINLAYSASHVTQDTSARARLARQFGADAHNKNVAQHNTT